MSTRYSSPTDGNTRSRATRSLGITQNTPAGSSCSTQPSATCFGLADFRSKANLTDITDSQNPISMGGNLTLTLTERGEPGTGDTVAVTVWNGSTLIFSSSWNGAQTLEQTLAG